MRCRYGQHHRHRHVTNRTEETWSDITVYAFAGDQVNGAAAEPMRNQGELALAMEAPFDDIIGDRILDQGSPGEVDELAPGESSGYVVTVPADAIEVTRAGVYWFGVHALGQREVPDDKVADGRARTFLPFVPRRYDATPVPASLVVPITQPVRYASDGSVADVEGWVRALQRPTGG